MGEKIGVKLAGLRRIDIDMTPKTVNVVIMFADVSDSTRLFETLGDVQARTKLAKVLALLADVVGQHKGKVIKTIGDEIMCTFSRAGDAAQAACKMQESIEKGIDKTQQKKAIARVRIGMHFGPILLDVGDIFGDAVNIAARMTSQSKGGQIIISSSTVKLLPSDIRTRFVDRVSIKGKKQAFEIHEIIWQEEDVTRMATGMLGRMQKSLNVPRLLLNIKYKDKEMEMNQQFPRAVLGRSASCDIPVDETLASRQHVLIELRDNKFFIIDGSTNGTYISLNKGKDAFLRRGEMPLSGSGRISLGRSFTDNPKDVIYFVQG